MSEADDAQKMKVLKKAVVKLKKQAEELGSQNEELAKKAEEHENKATELTKELMEAREEVDLLKFNNTTLTKKISGLQEDLKKREQQSGGWGLTGLKDIVSGNKAKESEKDVLAEELERKVKESEQLHAKLYDAQQELSEMKNQKEHIEGRYGADTTDAVTKISVLDEELRITKGEEGRLMTLLTERTEELSALQAQNRVAIERVQQMETRLGSSMALSRCSVLLDLRRIPSLTSLSLDPNDAQWAQTVAGTSTKLSSAVSQMTRDVEALFANATERIHILLSKANASGGPVQVAALRLLKDSLRKANTEHAAVSKPLVAGCESAAEFKTSIVDVIKADRGDTSVDVTPVGLPVSEASQWVLFLSNNLRYLLAAIFEHSPTADAEDCADEVSRLQDTLARPLQALISGKEVSSSMLRVLKGSVKELTEAVTSFFAKEVKVAWELAGFDSVNKRIMAALNALHSHIISIVDLRNAMLSQAADRVPGPGFNQKLPLLPPATIMSEEEKAGLPKEYLEEASPYKDVEMARARLHEKVQDFTKGLAVPEEAEEIVAIAAKEAVKEKNNEDEEVRTVAEVAEECALLATLPTPKAPDTAPKERELTAYKKALKLADSKAAEYRSEWHKAVYDLETRAEDMKLMEDDIRDLKRRLRNRDTEVKNMSNGYTEQMKVFQDRILDLENRLGAAQRR